MCLNEGRLIVMDDRKSQYHTENLSMALFMTACMFDRIEPEDEKSIVINIDKPLALTIEDTVSCCPRWPGICDPFDSLFHMAVWMVPRSHRTTFPKELWPKFDLGPDAAPGVLAAKVVENRSVGLSVGGFVVSLEEDKNGKLDIVVVETEGNCLRSMARFLPGFSMLHIVVADYAGMPLGIMKYVCLKPSTTTDERNAVMMHAPTSLAPLYGPDDLSVLIPSVTAKSLMSDLSMVCTGGPNLAGFKDKFVRVVFCPALRLWECLTECDMSTERDARTARGHLEAIGDDAWRRWIEQSLFAN